MSDFTSRFNGTLTLTGNLLTPHTRHIVFKILEKCDDAHFITQDINYYHSYQHFKDTIWNADNVFRVTGKANWNFLQSYRKIFLKNLDTQQEFEFRQYLQENPILLNFVEAEPAWKKLRTIHAELVCDASLHLFLENVKEIDHSYNQNLIDTYHLV